MRSLLRVVPRALCLLWVACSGEGAGTTDGSGGAGGVSRDQQEPRSGGSSSRATTDAAVSAAGSAGANVQRDGGVDAAQMTTPSGCIAMTCVEQGRSCGRASDGCNGQLECGTCADGAFCGQDGACTTTIECLAGDAGTLRQDVVVNGAGGLQLLMGMRRVEGNVAIDSVAQADLAQLACLQRVSGKLEISGGALVDLHGLEGLQSVGESLTIGGLSQLASLEALRELRSLPMLVLMDLPALTSLSGLEGLSSLAGFKPSTVANTSLGLTVARCNALRDLSGLEGVQHLGGMSLSDNAALTSLAGLDGVRTIGCASADAQCNPSDLPIEIIGCLELADLSALSNATGTSGLLRMNGNQRLTELTALHGLVFDDISLSRNTALVRISSQPFAATSIKTLYVNEQSALETLQGLENLKRTLLDGINIRDNPVLRSLDALSQVTTVTGSFIVRRSPQLTAIGFPMLTSITGSVYLEGLTMVPKCQVDALLARTGATCESCTGLDEAANCL